MGKIIALLAIVHRSYSRWMFRQLVSSLIVTAALTVVTSVMIGVVLAGCFYAAYEALLRSGVMPVDAQLIVAAVVVVITLILIVITRRHMRELQHLPRKLLRDRFSPVSHTSDIVNAFIAGFLEPFD